MAEWSKAAVLKTVEGQPSLGSNPSLSAIFIYFTDFDIPSNSICTDIITSSIPINLSIAISPRSLSTL